MAAKVFDDRAVFARELSLSLRLVRRWGPTLRGAGHCDEGGVRRPYLAFDLCEGEPLDRIRPTKATERIALALKVAHAAGGALEELHAAGLRHGDVKRENILVNGSVPKEDRAAARGATLIDLSLASELEAPLAGISPRYAPPEIGQRHPGQGGDLYALGLVLLEILAPGAAEAKDPRAFVEALGRAPLDEAVRALLSPSPGARPDAGWIAGLAARLLGLAPCLEERAENRHGIVRSTYMALREAELSGPFTLAPSIAGPPRAWLGAAAEMLATLREGDSASEDRVVEPLDELGLRRWATAIVGTVAGAWPVADLGEVKLAVGFASLAERIELGAIRFSDLQRTESAPESVAPRAEEALDRIGVVRALAAPRLADRVLRQAESLAKEDESLALVLAEALLRGGLVGRARVVLANASGELARATLAETLRRANERESARLLASSLASAESGDARDLASAVVARLAWDDGALEQAKRAIDGTGPRVTEVAALVAYSEGRYADGLRLLDRALADAPPSASAARLFATRGFLLHGSGVPDESAAALRRAVERAEEAGAVVEEATYRTSLAAALADAGRLDEALEEATRALLSWDRQHDSVRAARAWLARASVLVFCGEVHGALTAARCAGERARASGDARCAAFAELVFAEANALDPTTALGHVAAALRALGPDAPLEDRVRVFAVELAVRVPDTSCSLPEAPPAVEIDRAVSDLPVLARLEWWGARAHALSRASSVDLDEGRAVVQRVVELSAGASPVPSRVVATFRAEALARRLGLSEPFAVLSSRRRGLVRDLAKASGAGSSRLTAAFLREPWASEAQAAELATRGAFSPSEMEDLAAVLSLLGERERLRPLFEQVVDALVLVTRAERGLLLLSSPDGTLRARAARNFARADLEGEQLKLSTTLANRAVATREPVVATDALSGSSDVSASVHALRLRSVLAVPLVARGEVVGVVYLDDRSRRASFGEREIAHVSLFARLAAFAIADARDQARLRRALRHAERRTRAAETEAREKDAELERAKVLLEEHDDESVASRIVGRSAPMRALRKLVQRVGASDVPILVSGESGTGKELVARAIHEVSRRATRPFVSENCAAMPESLLESTLFGHVRGAFTGASSRRTGLFDAADGGTLFLDEVGEMSLALQAKLLRALQEGEVRPVGAVHAHRVDVRILAATNRDLAARVREGHFREDLYYRLHVVNVTVPPLRDRKDDVPLLVQHFVDRYQEKGPTRVTRSALDAMVQFAWPGNVRQLENEVRRALVLAEDVIDVRDLSDDVRGRVEKEPDSAGPVSLRDRLDRVETDWVRSALRECGGNQTRAAASLGVSRFGLQKMMKRLGIARGD